MKLKIQVKLTASAALIALLYAFTESNKDNSLAPNRKPRPIGEIAEDILKVSKGIVEDIKVEESQKGEESVPETTRPSRSRTRTVKAAEVVAPVAPVKAAEVVAPVAPVKAAEVVAPVAPEDDASTDAVQEAEEAEKVSDTLAQAIDVVAVRAVLTAAIQKDPANKPKAIAILSKFGATSVTSLDPKHWVSAFEQFKAL